MTDVATELNAVMKQVSDFVKRTPLDQLQALARGEGTLVYLPKGWKKVPPPPPPPPVERVPPEPIIEALRDFAAKTEATKYLKALGLSVDQLRLLCADLELSTPPKPTVTNMIAEIVKHYVGGRIVAATVQGA